jgi:hypothetical protein
LWWHVNWQHRYTVVCYQFLRRKGGSLMVKNKTVMIDRTPDPRAPVKGAVKVFWRLNGVWVHKGWLMPDIPYND